eukprot:gene10222-13412_t
MAGTPNTPGTCGYDTCRQREALSFVNLLVVAVSELDSANDGVKIAGWAATLLSDLDALTWGLTNKERNRLMHALFGNTSPTAKRARKEELLEVLGRYQFGERVGNRLLRPAIVNKTARILDETAGKSSFVRAQRLSELALEQHGKEEIYHAAELHRQVKDLHATRSEAIRVLGRYPHGVRVTNQLLLRPATSGKVQEMLDLTKGDLACDRAMLVVELALVNKITGAEELEEEVSSSMGPASGAPGRLVSAATGPVGEEERVPVRIAVDLSGHEDAARIRAAADKVSATTSRKTVRELLRVWTGMEAAGWARRQRPSHGPLRLHVLEPRKDAPQLQILSGMLSFEVPDDPAEAGADDEARRHLGRCVARWDGKELEVCGYSAEHGYDTIAADLTRRSTERRLVYRAPRPAAAAAAPPGEQQEALLMLEDVEEEDYDPAMFGPVPTDRRLVVYRAPRPAAAAAAAPPGEQQDAPLKVEEEEPDYVPSAPRHIPLVPLKQEEYEDDYVPSSGSRLVYDPSRLVYDPRSAASPYVRVAWEAPQLDAPAAAAAAAPEVVRDRTICLMPPEEVEQEEIPSLEEPDDEVVDEEMQCPCAFVTAVFRMIWALSRKLRNRAMHALNGNSASGQQGRADLPHRKRREGRKEEVVTLLVDRFGASCAGEHIYNRLASYTDSERDMVAIMSDEWMPVELKAGKLLELATKHDVHVWRAADAAAAGGRGGAGARGGHAARSRGAGRGAGGGAADDAEGAHWDDPPAAGRGQGQEVERSPRARTRGRRRAASKVRLPPPTTVLPMRIDAADWDVPVVDKVDQLKATSDGISICQMDALEQVYDDLNNCAARVAVLLAEEPDDQRYSARLHRISAPMHRDGRVTFETRWLLQLGAGGVVARTQKLAKVRLRSETKQVFLEVWECHRDANEAWPPYEYDTRDTRAATRNVRTALLDALGEEAQNADIVDIYNHSVSSGARGMRRYSATIRVANSRVMDRLLARSLKLGAGTMVKPLFKETSQDEYPLIKPSRGEAEWSDADARRKAGRIDQERLFRGIAYNTYAGVNIRTTRDGVAEVRRAILPEDPASRAMDEGLPELKRFEVCGGPLDTDATTLIKALSEAAGEWRAWEGRVLYRTSWKVGDGDAARRHWRIDAENAPPSTGLTLTDQSGCEFEVRIVEASGRPPAQRGGYAAALRGG